jgi:hypothetical protein
MDYSSRLVGASRFDYFEIFVIQDIGFLEGIIPFFQETESTTCSLSKVKVINLLFVHGKFGFMAYTRLKQN